MVTAEDLLDQGELAALLGVAESSLRAMRSQSSRHRRIEGLPEPIRFVGQAPVWDRRAVLAWLELREPARQSADDVWTSLNGCADAVSTTDSVDDVVYR